MIFASRLPTPSTTFFPGRTCARQTASLRTSSNNAFHRVVLSPEGRTTVGGGGNEGFAEGGGATEAVRSTGDATPSSRFSGTTTTALRPRDCTARFNAST